MKMQNIMNRIQKKLNPMLVSSLLELAQDIQEKRPHLVKMLEKMGNLSLNDYTEQLQSYQPKEVFRSRQEQILKLLAPKTKQVRPFSKSILNQLRKNPVLSTANHAGFLTHPFFLNSNVIYGWKQQGIVTISSGNIPLGNRSYPHCLLFSETKDQESIRLPLFKEKWKNQLVHSAQGYSKTEIQGDKGKKGLKEKIQNLEKQGWISWRKAAVLEKALDSILLHPEVIKFPHFLNQSLAMNEILWKFLFSSSESQTLCEVSLEHLTMNWLKEKLFSGNSALSNSASENPASGNPILNLILQKNWRNAFLQHFDQIMGAVDLQAQTGSFLFWGISPQNKRVPLQDQGEFLQGDGIQVSWEAKALHQAILTGRITPSCCLSLLILSFYTGFKLCGGFMQVDYLSKMKKAWINLLQEQGEKEEAQHVSSIPTDSFTAGPIILYVKRTNKNQASPSFVPATSLDLLETPISPSLQQELGKREMLDFILPVLPEIHDLVGFSPLSFLKKQEIQTQTVTELQLPCLSNN